MALLEGQIGPSLVTAVVLELARGQQASRLAFAHLDCSYVLVCVDL